MDVMRQQNRYAQWRCNRKIDEFISYASAEYAEYIISEQNERIKSMDRAIRDLLEYIGGLP